MSDRRREFDEQIGYLTARVEAIEESLWEHKSKEEERWERIEDHMQKMRVRVGVVRALVAIFKALGAATILVLSFKFGDIPKEVATFFDFK